ncbi:MAG: hypothetical protein HY584_00015, partial [Candidatus Omnitrophica bacterium]|nr:hypothetical protein [Candidatus Omnitrophota bacterium]
MEKRSVKNKKQTLATIISFLAICMFTTVEAFAGPGIVVGTKIDFGPSIKRLEKQADHTVAREDIYQQRRNEAREKWNNYQKTRAKRDKGEATWQDSANALKEFRKAQQKAEDMRQAYSREHRRLQHDKQVLRDKADNFSKEADKKINRLQKKKDNLQKQMDRERSKLEKPFSRQVKKRIQHRVDNLQKETDRLNKKLDEARAEKEKFEDIKREIDDIDVSAPPDADDLDFTDLNQGYRSPHP